MELREKFHVARTVGNVMGKKWFSTVKRTSQLDWYSYSTATIFPPKWKRVTPVSNEKTLTSINSSFHLSSSFCLLFFFYSLCRKMATGKTDFYTLKKTFKLTLKADANCKLTDLISNLLILSGRGSRQHDTCSSYCWSSVSHRPPFVKFHYLLTCSFSLGSHFEPTDRPSFS